MQSLPQCSRTSKLLPPCRGKIHGRQLRNNAKLTQPPARTNRYACSPIPYNVHLINSKLPLDFLLSIFSFACLLPSCSLFLCCLYLFLVILCFFFYHMATPFELNMQKGWCLVTLHFSSCFFTFLIIFSQTCTKDIVMLLVSF